jgi:flagellar hook assembly protein FlgD
LPKDGNVSLKIYNVAGQLVKSFNQYMTTGYRTITWDGINNSGETVASGVYFYRLDAEEFNQTKKMTLLK